MSEAQMQLPDFISDGIAKFQRKPVVVEAYFFATDDDGKAIQEWVRAHGKGCVFMPLLEAVPDVNKREEAHILLDTPLGDMQIEKGVWIVKETNDNFWPFTPDELTSRYDPHAPIVLSVEETEAFNALVEAEVNDHGVDTDS